MENNKKLTSIYDPGKDNKNIIFDKFGSIKKVNFTLKEKKAIKVLEKKFGNEFNRGIEYNDNNVCFKFL